MLKNPILCLLSMLCLGSIALPQVYVYGMSELGKVSVNGTRFFNLPGDFDPDDPSNPHEEDRWYHQFVTGQDVYHIRLDGLVYKNGERLLRNEILSAAWMRVVATSGGDVYCLDFLGHRSANGTLITQLPVDVSNFLYYQDLFREGATLYALRRDGKIYQDTTESWDLPGTSGTDSTRWMSFAIDTTVANEVYALRVDGVIHKVEQGVAGAGTLVVDLAGSGTGNEEYSRLVIDESGQLWAMREDGVVYQVDKTTGVPTLYADYDGSGNAGDDDFLWFDVLNGEPYAVRWDGRVYKGAGTTEIYRLDGKRYRRIWVSDQAPDTSNIKDYKTVVSPYSTTCYPGDSISFPIIASDINDGTIVYTEVETPAWGSLNTAAIPWVFSGTPPAEGKFTLMVEIGAQGKATKIYKYKISVGAPDTDPAKNKKPKFQKLKKVQALVGEPLSIPLRAYDADGDALTYAVDGLLPVWLSYDPMTQTLSGTPTDPDQTHKIVITADDGGGKLSKGKIQIFTETPFHF